LFSVRYNYQYQETVASHEFIDFDKWISARVQALRAFVTSFRKASARVVKSKFA